MDAKESIFRNTGAAVFNRNRTDILKEKYHLKERSAVPAPGAYNSTFSEFSGPFPLPKPPIGLLPGQKQAPVKIQPNAEPAKV